MKCQKYSRRSVTVDGNDASSETKCEKDKKRNFLSIVVSPFFLFITFTENFFRQGKTRHLFCLFSVIKHNRMRQCKRPILINKILRQRNPHVSIIEFILDKSFYNLRSFSAPINEMVHQRNAEF